MTQANQNLSWETELDKTAFRYNVLVAWVGIVLNPLWAIPDYFNAPLYFNGFLVFRLAVALATLVGVLLRHRLTEKPWVIGFIPFIGISIQNAYMYSVMNVEELQKHTFAYIALFIGAGMFILWRPIFSIVVVAVSFMFNIVFFSLNSNLQPGEILTNGGMLTASVAVFTILLINTRYNLTRKEIVARLALAASNRELETKNAIIEEKNKDINDSINYALRIQHAMLPAPEKLEQSLKDHFVLYKPKDIVSGDFYWTASVQTEATETQKSKHVAVVAAVDCTGHGVPGALMSIIGSAILNQSATQVDINTPAQALAFLHRELNKNLQSIQDGMDIALVAIDYATLELQYAGAHNNLYIIREGIVTELKADKLAIEVNPDNWSQREFTNHVFQLQKGDAIYLYTDGFADQFGGPKRKKFGYRQLQEMLVEVSGQPMKKQMGLIDERYENWRGDMGQVDDILIIGVRV